MASSDLVQSLLKGLDIMQIVGESEQGLRLADLAERSGLKKTTVHNLARTLMTRHFLDKEEGGRYILGPAVVELAGMYKDKQVVHQAVLAMQRLLRVLPDSTLVFVELRGQELRLSHRYSPDRPNVLQRPWGQTMNPYVNACGLAYLAYGADSVRQDLSERYPFDEFGTHFWKSARELEDFQEGVRTKGYAVTPFDTDKTLRVGVPLLDRNGRIMAAIGVSTPVRLIKTAKQKNQIIELTTGAVSALNM